MRLFFCLAVFVAGSAFFLHRKEKPVLYIIGDSTVRNGDGSGRNGQWGWGSVISVHFDTSRIDISNQAIGGRSSRTFITEGRWGKVLTTLKKGDFVLMQFGHNDAGPLDDTARARGTIKGIGHDSAEIYNPIRKMNETVYSFGHYMRQYVQETQAKGATPIICSPIPRNDWKDGKVVRSTDSYSGWAQAVAKETGVCFIDLNDRVASRYEMMGREKVNPFFPADHTHTDKAGAMINAEEVAKGIQQLKGCKLKKYLKK